MADKQMADLEKMFWIPMTDKCLKTIIIQRMFHKLARNRQQPNRKMSHNIVVHRQTDPNSQQIWGKTCLNSLSGKWKLNQQ